MAHATYSPKDVNIVISGVKITGFSDDDFLTLARTSEMMEPTVGADGILTRTKVADRTGTITLNLAQTAEANSVLAAMATASEFTPMDIPLLNFQISDPSGSLLAVGINAVLQKYPDVSLGATAGNSKEWVFHCEVLEYTNVTADIAKLLPTFVVQDGQLKKV